MAIRGGPTGLAHLAQTARLRPVCPSPAPIAAQRPRGVACASPGAASAVPAGEPPAQQQPASSSGKQPATHHDDHTSPATASGFSLSRIHVFAFLLIFVGGALFATLTLQFTADMEFSAAVMTVLTRVAKSVAFRQLVVIGVAILLVRYCLNGALKALATMSNSRIEWDKTLLFYILREVYQPLELLLLIAAICTVADTFVPSLIAVSKVTVSRVVKTILSTSFIVGLSSVLFNIKSRFCKENAWQAEMKGDVTQQRRWEAYDKLGTFVIYVMTFVLAIQAIGLEVTSVLAIGGIGGLAIGLAGREICENLLNGFLIMSTNPFEVGDEIHFFHTNKVVEGFVIDIGWYRTQIRSFEREVFVIPNSVFSKNIVLNITRKNREYRFFETILIRVQDVQKANSIIQDIRRIVRSDPRILGKLHRRIFLDKITLDECRIYLSFYLEAANRDAFMAIKQDMLLAFVDVVERNGAKLATPRTMVEMDKDLAESLGGSGSNLMLAGLAAAQSMAQQAQQSKARRLTELSTAAAAAAVAAASTEAEATYTVSSTSSAVSSSTSGAVSSTSGTGAAAASAAAVASGGNGAGAGVSSKGGGGGGLKAGDGSVGGGSNSSSLPQTSSTSSSSSSGTSSSQASPASAVPAPSPQSVPALPMSEKPVALSPVVPSVPPKPGSGATSSSKGGGGTAAAAPATSSVATATATAAATTSTNATTTTMAEPVIPVIVNATMSDDLWGPSSQQPAPSRAGAALLAAQQQQQQQAASSAAAGGMFGDVLMASFEDLSSIFESAVSYTDPSGSGGSTDSGDAGARVGKDGSVNSR